MNKNTGLYSRAESLKHPNVIGELHVSDHHYWIILLEAEGGENIVSSNVPLHSELCYFEVKGQLCAIVEDGLMPSSDRKDPDLIELLTERELQIARLVALGRLNKQIAHQLHISEWTVATHLRRIFAKLGVDTRAAMVYRCASLIGEQPAQASIVDPKNWATTKGVLIPSPGGRRSKMRKSYSDSESGRALFLRVPSAGQLSPACLAS